MRAANKQRTRTQKQPAATTTKTLTLLNSARPLEVSGTNTLFSNKAHQLASPLLHTTALHLHLVIHLVFFALLYKVLVMMTVRGRRITGSKDSRHVLCVCSVCIILSASAGCGARAGEAMYNRRQEHARETAPIARKRRSHTTRGQQQQLLPFTPPSSSPDDRRLAHEARARDVDAHCVFAIVEDGGVVWWGSRRQSQRRSFEGALVCLLRRPLSLSLSLSLPQYLAPPPKPHPFSLPPFCPAGRTAVRPVVGGHQGVRRHDDDRQVGVVRLDRDARALGRLADELRPRTPRGVGARRRRRRRRRRLVRCRC